MKKIVCMVGPFPPPMNGNSKAFDTIIKSDICNQFFDFKKVDLYRLYSGENGKLSLSKLVGVFSLKKIIKEIRKEEIVDTFYISNAQSAVGCIRDIVVIKEIMKQKKPHSIILHLHGGGFKLFFDNTNPLLRKIIKKYYSKADKVIVLGDSLKNMFEGIVPPKKVIVIPNCVDNDMLLSDNEFENKMKNLRKNEFINVLYLSNMIESKGYKDLLEAAVRVNEKLPTIKFTFAGAFKNSNDKDEFMERISQKDTQNYIEYLGIVDGNDKKDLLKRGNILVLPTYYPNEGQPISIIECMSAGMAIIATDHAGIKDLLCQGVNGLFVPKKSPKSIEKALKNVCSVGRLEDMCRESRKRALDCFTEDKYIDSICDVLQYSGGIHEYTKNRDEDGRG